MIDKQKRLVTAEAVRRGHPDKLCDQIADAILDAHLSYDPNARVAVEVMATAGSITVAGEVTSRADVNYEKTVLDVIQQIGYKWADLCEDEHDDLDIHIAVHEQSPDIAAAVDGRYPDRDLGAGDQGIMVGYATNETFSMMPRAFVIAQRICRLLDEEAVHTPWLGVDGKAQVSLEYEGDRVTVHTIVVSVQHTPNAPEDKLRELVTQVVYQAVGRADMWQPTSKLLVNPSGRFALGGPAADTGLTGRKLAVDQYGPVAHIGGGALSGKDASKVDRSGAYAARWIARNLVAAKLCSQCEVSIVYAIGVCHPVGIIVNTFGTGMKPDEELAKLVWRVFDLRPSEIIKRLKLNTPSYSQISVYGHFGRTDLNLPWEQDDMADKLRELAQYDQLLECSVYAKSLGLRVTVNTNGFWGRNEKRAFEMLTALKAAGVELLSFSADRYHQQYVPIEDLKAAMRLTSAVGMKSDISIMETAHSDDIVQMTEALRPEIYQASVVNHPMLPVGSALEKVQEGEFIRHFESKDAKCTFFGMIQLNFDGNYYMCCSQFCREIPRINLGSAKEVPLKDLERWITSDDYLYVMLRKGLAWYIDLARELGYEIPNYLCSACHCCYYVFRNQKLLDEIKDRVQEEAGRLRVQHLLGA